VRLVVTAALACAAVAAVQGGRASEAGATGPAKARAAAASSGAGSSLPASDQASFEAALDKAKSGDTIELAGGTYPVLTVQGKAGLTIAGSRSVKLDGLRIGASTGITLRGVTVTPSGDERAVVALTDSSRSIVLDGLLIDGRDEHVGAGVIADETVSDVTVRGSEITNCGRGSRCLGMSRTPNVKVIGNAFHDCLSCDFIRNATGMTIRGNTFDRAVHGSCIEDGTPCPHNDIIQIVGGGPWLIANNRFGDRQGGAASIYISPGINNEGSPIRDVTIKSNLFISSVGSFTIKIAGGAAATSGSIGKVSIVNNTVMSGTVGSLAIEPGWEAVPSPERPLVANNIFRTMRSTTCTRAVFVANVVQLGHARCNGLRKVNPALNARGGPTKASTAVVNKADPHYAPPTDYYGRYRNGRPDIGAVEFRGKKKASRA
jgi:hypothetical protein